MTTATILGISSIAGCLICIALVAWKETFKAFAILAIILAVSTLTWSMDRGKEIVMENLSQEVNLQRVPIRGQAAFNAQVQINYKDGKLDSVTLIQDTTVPAIK